ncbi:Imm-like superinfection immunity protein [Klebsiella phage Metamorpho]|nr:Imm-like superinfection immunity protein [Klebsiella phage Metamorpho]
MEAVFGLFIIIAIYFLPTFVACSRKHKSRGGIFITNLVFGWSIIGWLIALIWSASNAQQNTIIIQQVK